MSQPDTIDELDERDVKTVWPTIGAHAVGRLVGRLCGLRLGIGGFFTLGKLFALATIPLSLAVYAWNIMPVVCRRYTLTGRRVVIRTGLGAVEGPSIGLDAFDRIDVELLPGQEWLHCGELIFKHSGSEVFRLAGVSRPEVFRQACLKARTSLLSVRKVLKQQAGVEEPVA